MQVSAELLLVLGVHQFIHTLVHHVRLGKGEFPLIIPLMLVLRFPPDWDSATLSGAVSVEGNRIIMGSTHSPGAASIQDQNHAGFSILEVDKASLGGGRKENPA